VAQSLFTDPRWLKFLLHTLPTEIVVQLHSATKHKELKDKAFA